MSFRKRGGGGGGAGSGLIYRTPVDHFSAATRALAEAARDAAITNVPAQLADFTADNRLAIILTITGTDPDTTVLQVRRGNAWADVANPGPVIEEAIHETGAQIVAKIDTQLTNDEWRIRRTIAQLVAGFDSHFAGTDWRTQLMGAFLLNEIDSTVGSPDWRRTVTEMIAGFDAALGSNAWRTGGPGGGGITVDQATDAAGALLATLARFVYAPDTNTLMLNESHQLVGASFTQDYRFAGTFTQAVASIQEYGANAIAPGTYANNPEVAGQFKIAANIAHESADMLAQAISDNAVMRIRQLSNDHVWQSGVVSAVSRPRPNVWEITLTNREGSNVGGNPERYITIDSLITKRIGEVAAESHDSWQSGTSPTPATPSRDHRAHLGARRFWRTRDDAAQSVRLARCCKIDATTTPLPWSPRALRSPLPTCPASAGRPARRCPALATRSFSFVRRLI